MRYTRKQYRREATKRAREIDDCGIAGVDNVKYIFQCVDT